VLRNNARRACPSRRGHCCPRPSQIRASAIHAPGSSPHSFAQDQAWQRTIRDYAIRDSSGRKLDYFSPAWLFAPVSLTRSRGAMPPPCFSRTILYNGTPLPSTGSARTAFPGVISTIRALRLPVPNTGSLIGSLPRPSARLLVRSLTAETSAGPGPVQARYHRLIVTGQTQDLPGSWGIHPVPLPRSPTPVGPTDLTLTISTVLSPVTEL